MKLHRASRLALLLFLVSLINGCMYEEFLDPADLPEEIQMLGQGIVGGTNTSQWPAVGAYLIDQGYGGMCTATLVTNEWLLTAAHCVDQSGMDYFYIGDNVNTGGGSDFHRIAEVFPHPSYNPNSYHPHDIAVMRLQSPINDVTPIPINTESMNSWSGTWLHYVGFGSNSSYSGPGAGEKRETDIQIYEVYSYEYMHYTPNTNTCSGDSGGPGLVDLDGRWYVAGVNSSVGATQNGGDPCSGYGFEMRPDAELNFIDDYFDPYEVPTDDDDDDDDDNGDDDDDLPVISELPEPFVEDDYGQPEGCACTGARANHTGHVATAGTVLIVAFAGLIARRRS